MKSKRYIIKILKNSVFKLVNLKTISTLSGTKYYVYDNEEYYAIEISEKEYNALKELMG